MLDVQPAIPLRKDEAEPISPAAITNFPSIFDMYPLVFCYKGLNKIDKELTMHQKNYCICR